MPNRLAAEPSPYLRQHARNPVDWYPWGPEALERARREDMPILLSIGYSACHWCHVMERESFEDPAVAEVMNRSFVNVKVDREERPDVDQVYMRAVQAMTGHGGWPLTVFLTPDARPYYGGTYFPPTPHQGMPSFRQVLDAAARAFSDRRDDVEAGAGDVVAALTRVAEAGPSVGGALGPAFLDQAYRSLARAFDPAHGGFGRAPKFPQPSTLEVLFRHHARTGDPEALAMAVTTLRRMAAGGIRDHLAGGFHRYSVDARWLVPHFEKMLYDNALLAQAYLDGFRLTGDDALREVAEETLDWMLREMRCPDGGFHTAWDADSEGEEGRFYVWSAREVEEALGPEEARLFRRAYDVTPEGNFEGKSILWLPHDAPALAAALGLDPADLRRRLAAARTRLLEVRSRRVPPFRDEKVLTSWNGLAVRAVAEAGGALGRPDYLAQAERSAAFLLGALRRDGTLFRSFMEGEARIPGFLEDYASLGNALLSLHEATLERRWREEAEWCCRRMLDLFRDDATGVFHDSARDGETLFMRPRDPMDNATPSGNSLAAELLARLGHLLGQEAWVDMARGLAAGEREVTERYPTAFGRLLAVADRLEAPPVEVAVVGRADDPERAALLRAALSPFHRNRTVTGRAPGEGDGGIPLLEGRDAPDGRATAWLCQGYACRAPVTDATALADQMADAGAAGPGRPSGGDDRTG
ncbi:MAG: thioredoxin domain-containing protein [Gemmatimonadota bacterium]